jgi:ABC-2 type transport system ATP-binding protein
VRAAGLVKEYSGCRAVDGVDLQLAPGTIVGLIGPSGCGKTTLMRMLIGVTRPTDGELEVLGRRPADFTSDERQAYGYMPQTPVLFPNLTLHANLHFMASMYGIGMRRRRKRLRSLLEFVDLWPHRSKRLADCSTGMQRRLALAATLVHDPDLLFLDEPTAGIDPILRERFWTQFRTLRDEGRTLLVSTQYVGEAVSCDLVAVMSDGRLVTLRTPHDLARDAFGGDLIEIETAGTWLPPHELARIADQPYVNGVRRAGDTTVSVVVADAATDLERLRALLADVGESISRIDVVQPTYDEVFVAIIERDRATRASATDQRGDDR